MRWSEYLQSDERFVSSGPASNIFDVSIKPKVKALIKHRQDSAGLIPQRVRRLSRCPEDYEFKSCNIHFRCQLTQKPELKGLKT